MELLRKYTNLGYPGSRAHLAASLCTLLVLAFLSFPTPAATAKCLFISSYHRGNAWSDGVEQGLRSVLGDQCELRQFDMDTSRNKSEEYKRAVGLEAKAVIDAWKPDVVVAADDSAARYVIQPYFRDGQVPFVFCGINWTAEEYGLPYSNATGMLEVSPIVPMLEKAMLIAAPGRRAIYIGAATLTEERSLERFETAAARMGVELEHVLVATGDAWIEAYEQAQAFDFVVLGSNFGIDNWEPERIYQTVDRVSRHLTVTSHSWMMPYAMLGMTKVPSEHGEWAAKAALAILRGARPQAIPIVSSRKWDLWANESLLRTAGVVLPLSLKVKAKKVHRP